MKDKLFQLLYSFLSTILASKDFFVFLKDLVINRLVSFILFITFIIVLLLFLFSVSGCVVGDKAIDSTVKVIERCVDGVCYEKNKF